MKEDSKEGKFESGSSLKNEDGTKYRDDKNKPFEFTELKQMYDDAIREFTDFLDRVDPAVKSKLLNTSQGRPEEKYKGPNTNPSGITDRRGPPVRSLRFDDESDSDSSDSESTSSTIRIGHAPSTTRVSPVMLNLAAPLIPPIAGAVGQLLIDYAGKYTNDDLGLMPYLKTLASQPNLLQEILPDYLKPQSPYPTHTANDPGNPYVSFQPQTGQHPFYSQPGQQYPPFQPGQAGPTPTSNDRPGNTNISFQPQSGQQPFYSQPGQQYPPTQPGQAGSTPTSHDLPGNPNVSSQPQSGQQPFYSQPGQQYPPTQPGPQPTQQSPLQPATASRPSPGPLQPPTASRQSPGPLQAATASRPSPGPLQPATASRPSPSPTRSPPKQQDKNEDFNKEQYEVIKALKDIDDQVNIILSKLSSQ